MKSECANFPELNHEICQLEPHEEIVANYFSSRGLNVERLCAVKSNKKAPDFRFTGKENFVCICEVKKPDSPMGNLTKRDREYLARTEIEKLIEEAKEQNAIPIVTSEQWRLYHGETSYLDEKLRNTDSEEKKNARKIKEWLEKSPIRNFPFTVTIYRNDSFRWEEEELHDFTNYLIDSLQVIENGQVPRYWSKDFHTFNGQYRKARKDGRYVNNQIQVVRTEKRLTVHVQFSMGVNWEAIEGDAICRKAQRQIKERLKRQESEPEKVVRLVVIFMEQNLLFEYFSRIDELESEVNRRILSRFPEFSAVAFCENFDSRFARANFLVFHTANNAIPPLPRNIFNDGHSFQFPR